MSVRALARDSWLNSFLSSCEPGEAWQAQNISSSPTDLCVHWQNMSSPSPDIDADGDWKPTCGSAFSLQRLPGPFTHPVKQIKRPVPFQVSSPQTLLFLGRQSPPRMAYPHPGSISALWWWGFCCCSTSCEDPCETVGGAFVRPMESPLPRSRWGQAVGSSLP